MNDSFKTLLAFIGGVAAGAAFGILMAPDKGSETRKKILSRAKDLSDDLSDAAKDKYNEFLSWKDSMMEDAENEVKKTVNSYADKAENKIKNAHV
jgi:gas vesicle protein